MNTLFVENVRPMANMPTYPAQTILVVEVGSTAHGTGLPAGEDHDETAVFVEAAEQVLGADAPPDARMQRTQPEGARSGPGDVDRQLYSLRKFVGLALDGNPSILLVFWAPVIQTSELGQILTESAGDFIGRHVIARYRGYMAAQVDRIEGRKGTAGHGRRGGGKREELVAAHGFDTKFAMHAARLGFQGIELVTTSRLVLPIAGEPGEWLRAVRRGEVPFSEWRERIDNLDAELERLDRDEQYRAGPDKDAINRFCVEIHRRAWGWL